MGTRESAFKLGVAAAACVAALYGCAPSLGGHLNGSGAAGGAEGEVRFRLLPNDDIAIDLSIKHLRDPQRLEPPAWAYVAWIRSSQESPPLNLGTLTVSKDSSGELKTVTQLHAFDLFVTAEPAGTVEQPSGEPLFWRGRYE
jgi:hypothetical protein